MISKKKKTFWKNRLCYSIFNLISNIKNKNKLKFKNKNYLNNLTN